MVEFVFSRKRVPKESHKKSYIKLALKPTQRTTNHVSRLSKMGRNKVPTRPFLKPP